MCFKCPCCGAPLIDFFDYGAEYKRFKYPPIWYYRCMTCNYSIAESWQEAYNAERKVKFKAEVDAMLDDVYKRGKVLVW